MPTVAFDTAFTIRSAKLHIPFSFVANPATHPRHRSYNAVTRTARTIDKIRLLLRGVLARLHQVFVGIDDVRD